MAVFLRLSLLCTFIGLAGCNAGGGNGTDNPSQSSDTTPDTFAFVDQTAIAAGNTAVSNTITITGINAAAPISIVGGQYSIGGSTFINAAGWINSGQSVAVRLTANGQPGTTVSATLNIGGVTDTFSVTTAAPLDTTPDAFTLVDQTGVALSTLLMSNSITIAGIESAAVISIVGGEYAIGDGAYTSVSGSVTNGQHVKVRLTSSAQANKAVSATLTIGGVSDAFSVTTAGIVGSTDTAPDAFTFADQNNIALAATVTSNAIQVLGINAPTSISIIGGDYAIDGGAYTSAVGTVTNGRSVTVRLAASSQANTATSATLTIGGVSDVFNVTTLTPPDTIPNSFTFIDQTDIPVNSAVVSNSVTISGINAQAPISIVGGSYSIQSGAFTNTVGTITNGQTVVVRVTASSKAGETTSATLSIGGVSGTFSATTASSDTTPNAFSFIAKTGVETGKVISSEAVKIGGIDAAARISIIGGEYSIDNSAFTNAVGSISKDQTVVVRVTASPTADTTTSATLTIGGVSGTFSVTTRSSDTTPDAFTFTDKTGVETGKVISSEGVNIGGIDAAARISIVGGEYSIDNGAFTSAVGSISKDQTVVVRVTASSEAGETTAATLTIGGVSNTFSVTTRSSDTTPNAFIFTDETGVDLGSVVVSNAVTITGIDAPAPISIVGGEYSIQGGAFTSAVGTVTNGQTVVVRLTSSTQMDTKISATLTVGSVSDSFDATTAMINVRAQNWPMFGHDYDNTRASSSKWINLNNVSSLNIVNRRVGSGVTSTPVIVDNVVYYADVAGYLHARNSDTGAVIWSIQLQSGILTASPFVSEDSVYIGGEGSRIYAVDRARGTLKWTSAQLESTRYSRISSSPIVVDNKLIVGLGSYQVFIPVPEAPFRGSVVALDINNNGAVLWRRSVCPASLCGAGISVWSTAAVDKELKQIYIGTGQAYVAPAGPYSDALIAINYESGALVWSRQITPNDVYTINVPGVDHDVGAAPNLFEVNGRKLAGVGDKSGRYTAVDRKTGDQIWQTKLSIGTPIGGVMASSAYADGVIYVVSNTSSNWGNRNTAFPTGSTAFALRASNGGILWDTVIPRRGVFGGVSVANGLMYFMTYNGWLRVLNTVDGAIVKEVQVGTADGDHDATVDGFPNGSASGAVVYRGRVYVGYGWTWVANVPGGLAILETDRGIERTAAAEQADFWTCPPNYIVRAGLNTGFTQEGVQRAFVVVPPTTSSSPAPVWVPLTGSVESTNENLDARGGNRALAQQGFMVIAPVRRCANGSPTAGGLPNGTGCNQSGTNGWHWEPWNEGRSADESGARWLNEDGPDSRFFEAMVKCTGKSFNLDKSRIYLGGISSGGTMTNRALLFNSDFWAGGMPLSGEWYVTKDDGLPLSFGAARQEVIAAPAKIHQGRVGPYPLRATLSPMIVITLWGGASDIWNCNGVLCADYRPSTQAASNYYSSMPNVVHLACTGPDGHQWPATNRGAFNSWAVKTLASHPKGTAPSAFAYTPPPTGYSCTRGRFTNHY